MAGQTACAQLKAPVRLTRSSRPHSAGSWYWKRATWSSTPALATRIPTGPRSAAIFDTAASTSPRSATSPSRARARRPLRRASSATSSPSSTSRTATSAPARARVRACMRPSPRAPPVTRAIRPERSISIVTRKQQLARDHEALDLGRSLVDLEERRVAHELLDRELLDVPVAAEDLDGIGRDLHARVRREALRHRRVEGRPAAVADVEHPARLPDEQARGLDLRRHVGDQEV